MEQVAGGLPLRAFSYLLIASSATRIRSFHIGSTHFWVSHLGVFYLFNFPVFLPQGEGNTYVYSYFLCVDEIPSKSMSEISTDLAPEFSCIRPRT